MTLRSLYLDFASQLAKKGSLDSELEAEVIIRHGLGIERSDFFRDLKEPVMPAEKHFMTGLLERRLKGEPLSYILGSREFYAISIDVNQNVLIPRQETELLVDTIVSLVKKKDSKNVTIADVGTGSGAIAVAIALNLPLAKVKATDISQDALSVARRNLIKHGISDSVSLHLGNLLDPIDEILDFVVSNPPYIPSKNIAVLQKEVLAEPRIALCGGEDGLDIIRSLLRQAINKLSPTGTLIFEVGSEQAFEASRLAKESFPESHVTVLEDLSRNPRAVLVNRS